MENNKPSKKNNSKQATKKAWTAPEIRELNTQSTLAGTDTWNQEGDDYNPPIS